MTLPSAAATMTPAMKLDDTPPRALSTDPAERLVDAIDLPIGRWDREARLLFCNGPYTRWACRPSADLVGQTLTELYGPAAWAAARDAFAAAFGGKAVYYERRITHQGAGARWVRVQVFPDRNEQGEVEAVYTIGWDIHQDVV
jgi:PAS domain-containing protein